VGISEITYYSSKLLNASSQYLGLIYHDSLCIAAEGVLQEACKFRVSVWNVCTFSINQGGNHISQGGQRKVDFGGLLQTLTSGARFTLTFRSLKQKLTIQLS
jgi:hypothetical protein